MWDIAAVHAVWRSEKIERKYLKIAEVMECYVFCHWTVTVGKFGFCRHLSCSESSKCRLYAVWRSGKIVRKYLKIAKVMECVVFCRSPVTVGRFSFCRHLSWSESSKCHLCAGWDVLKTNWWDRCFYNKYMCYVISR